MSSPAFDMWALGVTFYEICTGEALVLSGTDNMLDSAGTATAQLERHAESAEA